MLAESLNPKDKDPKDQPQFPEKLRMGEPERRAKAWELMQQLLLPLFHIAALAGGAHLVPLHKQCEVFPAWSPVTMVLSLAVTEKLIWR